MFNCVPFTYEFCVCVFQIKYNEIVNVPRHLWGFVFNEEGGGRLVVLNTQDNDCKK